MPVSAAKPTVRFGDFHIKDATNKSLTVELTGADTIHASSVQDGSSSGALGDSFSLHLTDDGVKAVTKDSEGYVSLIRGSVLAFLTALTSAMKSRPDAVHFENGVDLSKTNQIVAELQKAAQPEAASVN